MIGLQFGRRSCERTARPAAPETPPGVVVRRVSAPNPDRGGRSAGQHLLDRLSGDAQLASDLRLGDALVDQAQHQVPPFAGQRPSQPRVLDRLGPHLLDLTEGVRVAGGALVLARGCRANLGSVRGGLENSGYGNELFGV